MVRKNGFNHLPKKFPNRDEEAAPVLPVEEPDPVLPVEGAAPVLPLEEPAPVLPGERTVPVGAVTNSPTGH